MDRRQGFIYIQIGWGSDLERKKIIIEKRRRSGRGGHDREGRKKPIEPGVRWKENREEDAPSLEKIGGAPSSEKYRWTVGHRCFGGDVQRRTDCRLGVEITTRTSLYPSI